MKRRTLLRSMAFSILAAPFLTPLAAASSTQSRSSSGTASGTSSTPSSESGTSSSPHATAKTLDQQGIPINWEGPDENVPQVFSRFLEAGAQVLAEIGQ